MGEERRLFSGAALDIGRNPKRGVNEDRLGVFEPVSPDCPDHLYVVCDGMGGHRAGEVASEIAVREIVRAYCEARRGEGIEESLQTAVAKAHGEIRAYALSLGERYVMGTTALVAVVRGERFYVANVGDSRAYRFHNGDMQQVTVDHSRAAAAGSAKGLLAAGAARHVLTRSLSSVRESVQVDLFTGPFLEGDLLVLCSDGLWASVPESVIARAVARSAPQDAAESLIRMANRAGGPDNISVIVVRRGGVPSAEDEDTGEFRSVRGGLERRP